RSDLEMPGLQGKRQEMIGRAEERCGVAARAAVAAVMAWRKAICDARHVGAASRDDGDGQLAHRFLQEPFTAARRRRRLEEFAARQHVGIDRHNEKPQALTNAAVIQRERHNVNCTRHFQSSTARSRTTTSDTSRQLWTTYN